MLSNDICQLMSSLLHDEQRTKKFEADNRLAVWIEFRRLPDRVIFCWMALKELHEDW